MTGSNPALAMALLGGNRMRAGRPMGALATNNAVAAAAMAGNLAAVCRQPHMPTAAQFQLQSTPAPAATPNAYASSPGQVAALD